MAICVRESDTQLDNFKHVHVRFYPAVLAVLSRPRIIILLDNCARKFSVHSNKWVLFKKGGDFVKFLLEIVNPNISDAWIHGIVFFKALKLRLEGVLQAGLGRIAITLVLEGCICTQLYLLSAVSRKRIQRLLVAY